MSEFIKNFDLSVLPVRQPKFKTKIKRKVDKRLMDIERGSCTLVIGRPRSGKTVLATNILMNSNFMKNAFDNVYIIGGSLLSDKSMRPVVKEYRATCYDKYSDKIIDDIIKYNTSFKQDEDDDDIPQSAIIIDDLIGLRGAAKHGNSLSRLASNYRHFGVKLLMILTQKLNSIPRTIRCCASDVILYKCDNIKEKKMLLEMWGDSYGGEKNLLSLMNKATKKKYNFLYLKLEDDEGATAHHNFTNKIYSPNDNESSEEEELEDMNLKNMILKNE